jgi:hypothetical protein
MISQNLHPLGKESFLKIIGDPCLCVSFSQFGEDTLIAEYLSGKNFIKRPRIYVDIGAYHPQRFSNTNLLRILGWRGLNVDPNPDSIKLFEESRPHDVNLNFGISSKSGFAELYCFREGAVNTFDKKVAENLVKRGWEFLGTRKVPLLPINELLDSYLPDEARKYGIGFLDIDCEGLDSEIIEGLDIAKFNPLIVSVEADRFDPLNPLANSVCIKMTHHGYTLGAYVGPTLLFWKINPDL